MTIITFTVFGRPQQKGSKAAFINRYTGKAQMMDDNKRAKGWQQAVSQAAGEAYTGPPLRGPVIVYATFTFCRPKKHFYQTKKRQGELREDAPHYHAQAPDVDKIVRSALDGMTGIVFRDDGQVQIGYATKLWGEQAKTELRIIPAFDVLNQKGGRRMTPDEAIAELRKVKAIVGPFGKETIDTVLGEIERMRAERAAECDNAPEAMFRVAMAAETAAKESP